MVALFNEIDTFLRQARKDNPNNPAAPEIIEGVRQILRNTKPDHMPISTRDINRSFIIPGYRFYKRGNIFQFMREPKNGQNSVPPTGPKKFLGLAYKPPTEEVDDNDYGNENENEVDEPQDGVRVRPKFDESPIKMNVRKTTCNFQNLDTLMSPTPAEKQTHQQMLKSLSKTYAQQIADRKAEEDAEAIEQSLTKALKHLNQPLIHEPIQASVQPLMQPLTQPLMQPTIQPLIQEKEKEKEKEKQTEEELIESLAQLQAEKIARKQTRKQLEKLTKKINNPRHDVHKMDLDSDSDSDDEEVCNKCMKQVNNLTSRVAQLEGLVDSINDLPRQIEALKTVIENNELSISEYVDEKVKDTSERIDLLGKYVDEKTDDIVDEIMNEKINEKFDDVILARIKELADSVVKSRYVFSDAD
jgi:hypothetical protein